MNRYTISYLRELLFLSVPITQKSFDFIIYVQRMKRAFVQFQDNAFVQVDQGPVVQS